jgi:hypothetical protein
MEYKMRITTNLLILSSLLFTPCSCALADVPIVRQLDEKNYAKVISESDCLHIRKGLTLIRGNGYQTKWNYSIPTYIEGEKKPQVIKTVIIGSNKSLYKKRVITLIPFRSLGGIRNPESQIGMVTVNGKKRQYFLFSSGSNLNKVLTSAKKRFGNNEFFSTEIDPAAPMLFIDAGIVQPNTSIRIEYEEKVIGGEIIPN